MPKYTHPHVLDDLVWTIDVNKDVVIGKILAMPHERSTIYAIELVGKMQKTIMHVSEALMWKFYDIQNILEFAQKAYDDTAYQLSYPRLP